MPENAVLIHAEKATHGATNTSGGYTLFAAVRTDEGAKPVKIEVKECINEGRELSKPIAEYFKQNGAENPYSSMYDGHVPELEAVEEIKTEAASSSAPRNSDFSAPSKYPSTASTISIADFLPLVNREFEKYLPKSEESSGKSEHSIADIIRLSPIEINKKIQPPLMANCLGSRNLRIWLYRLMMVCSYSGTPSLPERHRRPPPTLILYHTPAKMSIPLWRKTRKSIFQNSAKETRVKQTIKHNF